MYFSLNIYMSVNKLYIVYVCVYKLLGTTHYLEKFVTELSGQ